MWITSAWFWISLREPTRRNHDLGVNVDAAGLDSEGSLDDGAGLHLGDLGIGDAEAAATVAEHGVELFERVNLGLHFFEGDAHLFGHNLLSGGLVRYELVQRGIEEADGHSIAVHGLEDAFKVAALHGEELGEGCATAFNVGSEDHLAHGLDAVAFKEHVLGAAEADALGAEFAGLAGVAGGVGVGAHEGLGIFGSEVHDCAEVAVELGINGGHLTVVNVAGRAVERDPSPSL